MKFFIDTANVEEIRTANGWGLLDGVTTNPSLVAREGRGFYEILEEICDIVDGPVSAEAVSHDAEGLIKEARELSALHKNIVVKVPMTLEGLKAVKVVSAEGIKTNVTLVFSPTQALLIAKAGGTYVSPFIGRLDDISNTGMELIDQIMAIWKQLLDTIAMWLGVGYPPSLLFLVAFIFILLILLHYSVVISILTERNKVLAQEITLIRSTLEEAADKDPQTSR